MKVCIIGTGYVGLVTGTCLAEIGHNVICVDKDEAKIKLLNSGNSPIYEPGLDELINKNLKAKRISFTNNIENTVKSQSIIFIAVGTPPLPDGNVDLRYVEEVAQVIGKSINEYKIIVNKSTVPIGSGDWISMIINDNINLKDEYQKSNPNSTLIAYDVVSNPEFLREGSAIFDTFSPDRIVLGSSNKKAIDIMKKLYEPIINQNFDDDIKQFIDKKKETIPVVQTDLVSAEMIKYAANSFLATKISYINEIANICEEAGADVKMVAKGIGLDSRIGGKFLDAGIGWGGSCFPKDVLALSRIAAEYGINAQLLDTVINVNSHQRLRIIKKVQKLLKIVKGKTIGVLGMSFKPDTDDTRNAPAITIMNNLVNLGAKVKAYDPVVKISPGELNSQVIICQSYEELFEAADLVILATEWKEFKVINYAELRKMMRDTYFIDGRNALIKEEMVNLGYKYFGIGR